MGTEAAQQGNGKINYGWVIVGLGILVSCVGIGTMMSLAVFQTPLSTAMGWTRSGISFTALLSFLFMGIGGFFWGALSDRFGTRVVLIAGGALMGAGLIAASRASSLGEFQVCFGALVGFSSGSIFAPVVSVVTRWITSHRSLAVALISAGMGLGSSTAAPLAQWLISAYDWRVALFTLGIVAWAIIVPSALFVRNPSAAQSGAATASVGLGGEMTVGQALRTPQFFAVAFTFFCCCAAHSGPIFHMASFAIDRGITAMAAATILTMSGVASMVGKILCGLLADRLGAKNVVITGLALQAIAIALYLVVGQLSQFYAVAALFGFAYGGVMPLYAILVREWFGEKIMGTVFGAVAMMSTVGMALGPWLGGAIFDSYGSYAWMHIGSAGMGIGAVLIALTFRPPTPITGKLATN